jgi:hypothetical protein
MGVAVRMAVIEAIIDNFDPVRAAEIGKST